MSDRGVFRYCRFLGFQDTLLAQAGRQYFDHCYIQGATDFIFGGSAAYFDNCEIHVTANGYITAANTPKDQQYGYVFSNCKITGEPNALTYLGRPWRPYAATVFLNTEMSANVRPAGWNNWNDPAKEKTARYAEYRSTGPGGAASARAGWAHELTDAEAKTYSIETVLGGDDGWNPKTGEARWETKVIKLPAKELPAPLKRGSVLLAAAVAKDGLRFFRSRDGYQWVAAGGAQLADPDLKDAWILLGPDGTFHLVWSGGKRGDKSFHYASSKNLHQWTTPRRIEIMAKQNALDVVSPHLFWDTARARFIVTWGSTMAANSIQAFQEEVDNNPRIFYATTRDFLTFTGPELLFDPNYSVKDGTLIQDGMQFALLHNDNSTPMQDLRVAFAPAPEGPWGPSRDAFTPKFFDNPAAIQLAGEWWIYDTKTSDGATTLEKTRDFSTFTDYGTVRLPGGLRLAGVLEVPGSIPDKIPKEQ